LFEGIGTHYAHVYEGGAYRYSRRRIRKKIDARGGEGGGEGVKG
jgi:hypothetical protein